LHHYKKHKHNGTLHLLSKEQWHNSQGLVPSGKEKQADGKKYRHVTEQRV
jgi:hypothetical protein